MARPEPAYQSINTNAKLSIEAYPNPNRRTYAEYKESLNFDSTWVYRQRVLDVGTGFAFAPMEMALKSGASVVAINVQDTVGLLAQELSSEKPEIVRHHRMYTKLDGVGSLDTLKLVAPLGDVLLGSHRLREVFDSHKEGKKVLAAEVARLETTLSGLLSNQLQFRAQYAEEVLPDLKGSVDRLIDFWGAFAYSPERIALLEGYYEALAPEGQARILVSGKMKSTVLTPKGPLELHDYLVKRLPRIFSLEKSRGRETSSSNVLVMTRDPKRERLGLELKHVGTTTPFFATEAFAPPELTFRARS